MDVTTELRRQLMGGSSSSSSASLSAALEASEAARRASDAALCQLAEDMRTYQVRGGLGLGSAFPLGRKGFRWVEGLEGRGAWWRSEVNL